MTFDWRVLRRGSGALRLPTLLEAHGIRLSQYTTRGNFPMTGWRVRFPNGLYYVTTTIGDAKRYAELNAERNGATLGPATPDTDDQKKPE